MQSDAPGGKVFKTMTVIMLFIIMLFIIMLFIIMLFTLLQGPKACIKLSIMCFML